MKHLFSMEGLRSLRVLDLKRSLLGFDYDGTLVPIRRDRDRAFLAPKTRRLLLALRRKRKIAILSGRGLSDLKRVMRIRMPYMVGNHGIEGIGSRRVRELAKRTCRRWKRALSDLNQKNVELEDKKFSLSLHYRKSKNRNATKEVLMHRCLALVPKPRIIFGKCVINLVPRGSPNKGTALLSVMKKARAHQSLFVGDDKTDEDAFKVPRVLSVCVGNHRKSAAHFYIRYHEINRLLLRLLEGENA